MKSKKKILIAITVLMITGCNAKDKEKPMTKAISVEEYTANEEIAFKRYSNCYKIKKKIKKKELPPMTDIEKQDCKNAEAAYRINNKKKYKDWSGVMSGGN